ncbi:hypothetical protein SBA_ch1_19160 [Sphingomonas bisphenolicum]|uniref:Uncharacterized protein n=1 Tax=Sphingomonas bisphenolicum TaxID=296544 RepID=A0ABM7G403_9SPHN|nr:hypothetical protein SBA_ch1_19160 [Sphingomonas bisphenolicum]
MAAIGQGVGERGYQAHEERVGQMLFGFVTQRQHHADRTRSPESKIARCDVDLKIMVAGKLFDPVSGRLCNQRIIRQGSGNSGYGYPGKYGKIGETGGFLAFHLHIPRRVSCHSKDFAISR